MNYEFCYAFSSPTYQGLVVPVLRDANKMNFADIEREMNLLGEKVSLICNIEISLV